MYQSLWLPTHKTQRLNYLQLLGNLGGLVGETSALEWQRSWVRIPPELNACEVLFTEPGKVPTEYTMLTHIGVWVKLNNNIYLNL